MTIERQCESRTGEDVLGSLRAEFADRCRSDARFLRLLHEAGRAVAGRTERLAALDEFSGDEVASALGWSRSMSSRQLNIADDLVGRLSPVLGAMQGGVLELGKAALFSEVLGDLDDDHAVLVCAAVLPRAPELNRKQIVDELETAAAEVDPQWAQRRQAAEAARGDVFGRMNSSGTADVVGRNLDADRAWAGVARVEALAVRLRAMVRPHGLRRPIEWLRQQVLQRLMDGQAVGLDDEAMLAVLAEEIVAETGPDDVGPDDVGPDDVGPDDVGPDDVGPDDVGPDGGPEDVGPVPRVSGPSSDGAGPGLLDPGGQGARGLRRGVLEVRLRLSTALGIDDLPGELAARGPLLAHTARTMIGERAAGEWRLVLTTDEGHLEHLILLTARPDPSHDRRAGARRRRGRSRRRGRARDDVEGRSIVELQVPTTMLAGLDPAEHPQWTAVLVEARARLADPALVDPDRHPATGIGDARRRRAGAELDRWTRARDRHCIGVMCHQPAHGADLDHTLDWAHGGMTVAANLGSPCRHCHRLKHVGGWRLTQPSPGRFRWRSRAGAAYVVRPRPVTRTPAPASPRSDGRTRVPVEERFVHVPTATPAWIPWRPGVSARRPWDGGAESAGVRPVAARTHAHLGGGPATAATADDGPVLF